MNYRYTSLRRTTEPAALAVTRTTAKSHLRVSHSDEDSLIDLYIGAAVRYVEEVTGRALVTQSWTMKLRGFGDYAYQQNRRACGESDITLPRPPLASITTFSYLDTDGASQTVSASLYTTDTAAEPGVIRLNVDEDWPDVDDGDNTVTVVYACGYGASESSVPEPIRQAILLLVGHMYENRESTSAVDLSVVPQAVDALLAPFRLYQV